jgi:Carboxypeptidase regulatory-like domain/TonB-dependent Receptor Plug Domain/TonB dependent receptor
MAKHSHLASIITLIALAILVSGVGDLPLCGQVTGATLSGTVTDASGAVIPSASLSIKNLETGVIREVTSDTVGFYTAPNLLPGTYEVSVRASGFATEVHTGFTLTVGAQQALDFKMRIGGVAETVRVTGQPPLVQLTSSTLSADVDETTVRELPLNGRSWTDLAALQPGVAAIENQPVFTSGDRGKRGFGSQLTIDGQRPVQNNYRLDGISINDYANAGPGSVIGVSLGVDAIQEFSVLTSNYSAEYGRTSGGVVNAITKSGTNQFHGSAYWFLRDEGLDAKNFFDRFTPATPYRTPPFHRNQFGASGGAPIRKDRTFFFADYEGIRQVQGNTVIDTVPSPSARMGQLCSAPGTPPVCTPTTVTVDPSATKYLALFPLPNGPLNPGGDTGNFTTANNYVVTENFFTTRIDHKISNKDSLSGTFLYDDALFTTPDALSNVLLGSHTKRFIVPLEWNHIFSPSLINAVRVGYNRNGVSSLRSIKAINPAAADTSFGPIPGVNAADVAIGGGLTEMTGGVNGPNSNLFYWNSFQGYDDAFLTHGTHSLKFGANVERMDFNTEAFSQQTGAFTFGTLQQFLTNQPTTYNSIPTIPFTMLGWRQTLFGAYLQDDWRWRRNVTLNIGLRYEMVTGLKEAHNRFFHLNSLTDPTATLGAPLMPNPTLRNFEPRVGFSWDPFDKGKTAVRGGFGIFDVLPMAWQFFTHMPEPADALGGAGFVNGPVLNGTFYTGAQNLITPNARIAYYIDQHPKRDYVMQWNLNVQHELAHSLTAMVGYAGSRGVHQNFGPDAADMVLPTHTSVGFFWPNPVGSGIPLNPNFGQVSMLTYGARSYFDALETSIIKTMSHGVQIQGSFTWGKSMDNSSVMTAADSFQNSIASLEWFDLKLNRGVSDFNVGRTLVINGIWNVPEWKSAPGFAGRITNGWQLGSIFTAKDGIPFTATLGSDGDPLGKNSNNNWDFPNRLSGPGCSSLVNPGNPDNYIKTQCFVVPSVAFAGSLAGLCDTAVGQLGQCLNLRGDAGRNILTGPGLVDLDFSIFKNNYISKISDTFNVQFRVEIFNILNRANFNAPVLPNQTDIFDSTGAPNPSAGQLTSTVTPGRQIQLALKLLW